MHLRQNHDKNFETKIKGKRNYTITYYSKINYTITPQITTQIQNIDLINQQYFDPDPMF
jgi:hypothetical protein